MSDDSDSRESNQHHHFWSTATVVAAILTVLAAVIGLVTVIIDRSSSSGEGSAQAISTFTEPDRGGEESGENDVPGESDRGDGPTPDGEAQWDPSHDGNSRSSAKELKANQPLQASMAAANDEDWYVYRAPKEETATVEVVPFEREITSEILSVSLFEGTEEIAHSADASDSEPFVVPRGLSQGARLFLYLRDSCGDLGCSIGPYRVVVRTGPPG
jgi:hypothetical protein